MSEPFDGARAPRPPLANPWKPVVLVACTLLTLLLGVLKLEVQRRHPPSFASSPVHTLDGYVAIDGYGQRAVHLRDWLRGRAEGRDGLRRTMSEPFHPTSWLVPALVAITSLAAIPVPAAFALWSALAVIAQICLAARLVRALWPAAPDSVPAAAALLTAAHCLVIRTSAQLILDPFVAACGAASLLLALRWIQRPSAGSAAALSAIHLAGVFVKDSYLPFVALPALLVMCLCERRERPRRLAGLAVISVVPLAVAGLFLAVGPGLETAAAGVRHLQSVWDLSARQLGHFALEMALLLQVHPLSIAMGWRRAGRAEKTLALALLVLLCAIWVNHLPAIPRLYLPVVAPLAALAATAWGRRCTGRWSTWLLAALLIANYAVAAAGLVGMVHES